MLRHLILLIPLLSTGQAWLSTSVGLPPNQLLSGCRISPGSSSLSLRSRLPLYDGWAASRTSLSSASTNDDAAPLPPQSPTSRDLTKEELATVQQLFNAAGDLRENVKQGLPNISPTLLVKLRQFHLQSDKGDSSQSASKALVQVSTTLEAILDDRLNEAKNVLEALLAAGEVRKLDSLIGQAARDGNLDAAFFQILSLNLKEATESEDRKVDAPPDGDEPAPASRLQVLQHVYTRCQEEMEKKVPPGLALLNKLMRTPQDSIRRNLYEHYLTPPDTTIKSPDGTTIELSSSQATPRVSISEFVDAMETTVKQIRTVEKAGGTDRAMAATVVESCRSLAKEARIVVGESFGTDSQEVKDLEDGLQPVFRPSSPESVYMQGIG